MRKKHIFFYASTSLILALILAIPAYAQDDTEIIDPDAAVDAAVETAAAEEAIDAVIEESGLSAEALEDEVVTEEDLGAEAPGRFHFFKKVKRTVQKTITRDPVKKAEFEIEAAHEELLRAKKLAEENPDDSGAQRRVRNALDDFAKDIEKVKNRAGDIKENRPDQASDFLDKIADMQVKQQKVLDKIEERMPENVFEKIKETRENVLRHAGEAMFDIESDPERIAQHFNAAFENQRGSEFREFKNLEVLERLENFVPEQAKQGIRNAQDMARKRFETQLGEIPENARADKFKRYIEFIPGDAIQHMRVLDDFKAHGNFEPDFFQHIEAAKEKSINRFEDRFRRFEDPLRRNIFMDDFADGSVENLRIMEQFKENLPEEIKKEIQAKETESIQRFKEHFIDDPDAQARANKFKELSRKMRENPDPATFALIQQLENELPPDQRAFVDSMSHEFEQGFEDRFEQEREGFLRRIESFDPGAIGHLQDFRGQAPPEIQAIIGQAMNRQIDFVSDRMDDFDDPARFDRFREQMENNPEIRQQIEFRHGDFDRRFESKEGEIGDIKQRIEGKFNARIEEEKRFRQEAGLPDFSPDELENLKQRHLLRPQFEAEEGVIERFRFEQEERSRRGFQNQLRKKAEALKLEGDELRDFLKESGFDEKEQFNFEQGPPAGAFERFDDFDPEFRQKLETRFEEHEQDFRRQIDRGGFLPPKLEDRIQDQKRTFEQRAPFRRPEQDFREFEGDQGGDRGQASPTGEENRFDPRGFEPGDRGDFRNNEAQDRNDFRQKIKEEFKFEPPRPGGGPEHSDIRDEIKPGLDDGFKRDEIKDGLLQNRIEDRNDPPPPPTSGFKPDGANIPPPPPISGGGGSGSTGDFKQPSNSGLGGGSGGSQPPPSDGFQQPTPDFQR